MTRRLSLLLLLLAFLLAGAAASPAAERATLTAEINYAALPPGQQAVVAIRLDIAPGLHAQAHDVPKPYIAMTVTPRQTPGVRFLPVQYPPAQTVEYPALGKLSVYTGGVIFYLPLQLAADARPGTELQIAGSLRYQACDEHTCFPPKTLPFSVSTRIAAPGEATTASQSTIFSGFDPKVFAAASAAPAVSAAPGGGAMAPGEQGVEIHFFGWSFVLQHSAHWLALGVALLVGILFNLMPCVLPVLPLKAIGFYEVSRHNRSRSLLLGAIFSLGLLAAFAVLAVLVVVYQAAWGSQFSKPWFVWTMVAILTLFALGMFGAFTVLLPARVYNFAPSHETLGGNFLFGAFTALLSTPCTAPMFVGLLAWAGQQPRWLGVSAVLMVGVGMALPYFVLSALPELARRLPRAGPWSELIKRCMAFLILAVAAYFAAGQLIRGPQFIWAVVGVIAAGCVYLVARAFALSPRPRARLIATAVALLVALGSYSFARNLTQAERIPWQPYADATLASAQAAGKTVMLEFTANWCSNCIELEARVLRNPRVAAEMQRLGIVPLRADLSHEDAPGWRKLQEINPSGGIPLTVIYSARHEPIYLSSVYTTDHLLRSLARAAE